MRVLTTFLVVLIITFAITYGFCAFIHGSFDSSLWPVANKVVAVFFCFTLSVVGCLVLFSEEYSSPSDSETLED